MIRWSLKKIGTHAITSLDSDWMMLLHCLHLGKSQPQTHPPFYLADSFVFSSLLISPIPKSNVKLERYRRFVQYLMHRAYRAWGYSDIMPCDTRAPAPSRRGCQSLGLLGQRSGTLHPFCMGTYPGLGSRHLRVDKEMTCRALHVLSDVDGGSDCHFGLIIFLRTIPSVPLLWPR